VVILEESGFAAPSLRSNKRAAAGVALPYRPFHFRRNVTRSGGGRPGRSGTIGHAQLRPLELGDKKIEGAFHNRRGISVRYHMPQEILRSTQLRIRLSTDGHLNFVSFWREGLDICRA
jgi:hypothetical protein